MSRPLNELASSIRYGGLIVAAAVLAAGSTLSLSGCKTESKAGPAGSDNAQAAIDPVATSQIRERALLILTEAARSNSAEQRANAVEALQYVPSRLAAVLPVLLADTNPGVRAIAAKVAGRTRQTQVVTQLQTMTSDPVSFVRAAAIYALVRCGQPADQTPLAQMLFSQEPSVRAEAAFLIGELGNRSALQMIKEAAARGMPRVDPVVARKVQLQLAEAMCKLGEDTAVQEIRAALYPGSEKEYENAALAAQILGQIGDRPSADQLIYITAFQENGKQKLPAELRLAAASALAKLGNDRGSFIADEYANNALAPLRAQSAFVYGETGRRANLAKLGPLLNDKETLVRISAAAAVLKISER